MNKTGFISYEAPSVKVILVETESILCVSGEVQASRENSTEGYTRGSFSWGDDE